MGKAARSLCKAVTTGSHHHSVQGTILGFSGICCHTAGTLPVTGTGDPGARAEAADAAEASLDLLDAAGDFGGSTRVGNGDGMWLCWLPSKESRSS